MIENKLQFLGLKNEEIKIYLALLKRGQTSVTAVANFTKTPRINCYHHLQNLKKQGFVIESRKNKMKHFSAENPKIFLAKAQEQKNVAEQILPELESLTNTNSTKPKIQFFEDRTGIKQIFDRLTDQKTHTIFSFTNFQQLIQIVSLPILKKHFLERTKKGIKSRIICANNEIAQILNEEIFAKHTPFFEVFFVDEQKFPLKSEITLLEKHVITLNLNQQTPIGTVMEDTEVYKAQKTIFDLAWMAATSFIGQ